MALLQRYRVLDFTDDRGLLAGRILADLGADVVQVEPVTGSSARTAEPMGAHGSYFWDTYAANKRGIAVDFDDAQSRAHLDDLIAQADVVIESAGPGGMESLGLGFDKLHVRHPRLIYVSISAFGSTGPKARYAASDLAVWAAGGPLDPHREGDRPPVRISIPQAFLHAAADAADGALFALLARERSGRGQHVDVSAQACLGTATLGRVLAHTAGDVAPEWEKLVDGPAKKMDQSGSGSGTDPAKKKWICVDGLIEFHLSVGPASGAFTTAFFEWMAAENEEYAEYAAIDWRTVPEMAARGEFDSTRLDEARSAVARFLAGKTKNEVLEAARERRLLCVPVYDTGDVVSSPQLGARGFYSTVSDAAGRQIRLPGAFAKITGETLSVRTAAPTLGQHTDEVLGEWVGDRAMENAS
ncbi:CoA transferase [Rhodococcus sp. BP-252]|uniref:CoA-transferase n=1 Tax=Rhodococcoides kyotonense TaxID=398843 RepID=A0A177YMS8_9NOCA|nr:MULTISPECIES: CoA transferase [Rhodococcus]MBY6412620.1 CoA transferase [Rhodococcus sp. BP-320]MBY6417125.1 CoA transferase [Rhodococcus sp. BP-321]MBY6423213.1 CoA transferase [Rhodococcus sp. BP-324]MBY6427149.1 CoA transferase [Rhodococcus sp. BP-323]MBY6432238.1 CoA transferase [Rhodococcus sp. BP-322]